jgi:alpha-1,3-glucosyltransferase
MDYPPLCAEMHYLMAKSIKWLEPEAFEVTGYATTRYIFLMRSWVIIWEYLIFVPAAVYFLKVTTKKVTPFSLFVITCIPSTLIVDNVHFQFNQVMHGLVLWAIAFVMDGKIALATVAMVLSVNFKQMSLYFALPFGVYSLAQLLKRYKSDLLKTGAHIVLLIAVFVATNVSVWSPFLLSGGVSTFNDILFRIFPIRRGIFESKVATFWCLLNHCGIKYFKVNSWERPLQLKMTTIATLIACVPSLSLLYLKSSRKNFLFAQLSVCLAFFMLSMQVHEKQILSPIFILCLCVSNNYLKKQYIIANMVSLGSMFGLIILNESWLVLTVLMTT